MPTVHTSVWIAAPREKVYAISKDNSSFPEFMKDVQSLTVVEQEGARVVSEYVATVSSFGLKVRWTQEDVWDDEAFTCAFRQIEGDYDLMQGIWRYTEENGGTRFDSDMEYEYVVPGLGPLVKKVVHSLVGKNVQGILDAIKARAEA